MCGRYSIGTTPDVLAAVFKLATAPPPSLFEPRYNIAPTQLAPVIRMDEDGCISMDLLKWGLIPSWADDPAIGNRMINARAETAAEKPAFRKAFAKRRCLIPADAFYEWKKVGTKKHPYAIRMRDGQPFAIAGLWETWRPKSADRNDAEIESFTILTIEPNELVKDLHNRMPAILDPADYARWLDPLCNDVPTLMRVLRPPPSEQMVAYPVNPRMNRPEHEGPDCLTPMKPMKPLKPIESEPKSLFES